MNTHPNSWYYVMTDGFSTSVVQEPFVSAHIRAGFVLASTKVNTLQEAQKLAKSVQSALNEEMIM